MFRPCKWAIIRLFTELVGRLYTRRGEYLCVLTQTARFIAINKKCDTESAECDTESAECDTESAECNTESAECDTESAECDTESAECDRVS